MRTRPSGLKWLGMVAVAAGALFAARDAAAQCTNDIDCPEPACGGQVCDWNMGRTCQPAGTAAKGLDGWCTTDADCKCKGLGATCNIVYCTFTKPSDAPGGGTGGASGSGTGGASSPGTGGASSSGTGGASSSGTGGASSPGTGGASPPKDSGGGGCAVAGSGSASLLGALIALGVLVAPRRRRKRA